MKNRIAKNRRSPVDENAYIQKYIIKNPSAKRKDNYDIAAVIAKDGTKGHGLLSTEFNRSHDRNYHVVKNFIADTELSVKK